MDFAASDVEILGAGYSYHLKPFSTQGKRTNYLLRLQAEGYSYALLDNKLVRVNPGDLLLYKPGDSCELRTAELVTGSEKKEIVASGDYYMFCQGKWIDAWWQNNPKPIKISIGLDETVISMWKQIIAEKRRVRDEVKEITGHLLKALCLAVDRSATSNTVLNPNGMLATSYRIKHFIERNAASDFKLEDVAKYVGLSVSRVVHLFKATFGQTVIEYTIEVRLAIASEQIRLTDHSLEQISQQSGFHSYSYFHRVFRNHYKLSPKEYRRENHY